MKVKINITFSSTGNEATAISPTVSFESNIHGLYSRLVAMSSRHHPGAGDQGASAEVVASVQRDLVGHRVLSAFIASNDLVILILNGSSI